MLWFFETDYWFFFICRQDRSMFLVIFHILYFFSNVLLWYLILVFLSRRSYQVYIFWRTWFDVCVQDLYSLWRLHVNWFGTQESAYLGRESLNRIHWVLVHTMNNDSFKRCNAFQSAHCPPIRSQFHWLACKRACISKSG